ncbi:hypothetical protein N9M70_01335 [Luminiphilus sp.]|nr:hypothetical protein [Luminiphilus sp.]
MKKILLVLTVTLTSLPVLADDNQKVMDHHDPHEMNHGEMNHGEMNHGEMNHDEMNHDEMNHDEMDHGQMNHGPEHNHGSHEHPTENAKEDVMTMSVPAITTTDDISAALANGGAPVVVDVLGVVCDFCAVAMNKIFGKREEVSALYVDLDKKTLSLVVNKGASLSDQDIENLAKRGGISHRGDST